MNKSCRKISRRYEDVFMAEDYSSFMCSLCMTNSITSKLCTHFMDSISTMYYKLITDHNLIIYKFLRDKKKMKTQKIIDELNKTKSEFMHSLNVCDDIKRHIYSFM